MAGSPEQTPGAPQHPKAAPAAVLEPVADAVAAPEPSAGETAEAAESGSKLCGCGLDPGDVCQPEACASNCADACPCAVEGVPDTDDAFVGESGDDEPPMYHNGSEQEESEEDEEDSDEGYEGDSDEDEGGSNEDEGGSDEEGEEDAFGNAPSLAEIRAHAFVMQWHGTPELRLRTDTLLNVQVLRETKAGTALLLAGGSEVTSTAPLSFWVELMKSVADGLPSDIAPLIVS
jgi:hypothetical protein